MTICLNFHVIVLVIKISLKMRYLPDYCVALLLITFITFISDISVIRIKIFIL